MNFETLILLAKPYLDAFVAAFIPIFGTMLVQWMSRREHNDKWQAAVARAASTAYAEIVQSGKSLKDPEVMANATASGVRYLMSLNPQGVDALKAPGMTQSHIAVKIVKAEFGKLLAADPTVKIVE